MRNCFIFFLVALSCCFFNITKAQIKVIDMHAHSYTDSDFGEREPATDYYGNKGAFNVAAYRKATFAEFKKWDMVAAMVSGNPESVATWVAKGSNHIVIHGLLVNSPTDYRMDTVKFEQMKKDKKTDVFEESAPYYVGAMLADASWQAYLQICEKYDIPVAVQTGGGDPGATYSWSPKARLKYGDPYLIEEVLVNCLKLRIYLMHAGGEDWHEHALRLMAYYPQFYTDVAVMLWVEPNTQRTITDFLRNSKHAGYINKVMFGPDQMIWPYATGKSIEFLNSLPFPTEKRQRRYFV